MSNGKAADNHNIIIEMIKMGNSLLHDRILQCFNEILDNSIIDENWYTTIFRMLPKQGDLNLISNWRPIAILPILQKLFSRLLFQRLQPVLERAQCHDQLGFRYGQRIECAFTILDGLVDTTREHCLDLWLASLDLSKAFDRVQFSAIFDALNSQGVQDEYIHLLRALYARQNGIVHSSRSFLINRGVKQGDVLSSLLFNAAVEMAFISWKQKLLHHG
eukprot:894252-Karenia_brevis.AAC.1